MSITVSSMPTSTFHPPATLRLLDPESLTLEHIYSILILEACENSTFIALRFHNFVNLLSRDNLNDGIWKFLNLQAKSFIVNRFYLAIRAFVTSDEFMETIDFSEVSKFKIMHKTYKKLTEVYPYSFLDAEGRCFIDVLENFVECHFKLPDYEFGEW